MLALKKEHPKAAHYCFAYPIGTDRNNFRIGDEGEPVGTLFCVVEPCILIRRHNVVLYKIEEPPGLDIVKL